MTAAVVRFPARQSHAIWITREDAAWVVLAYEHGWAFGCRQQALAAAQWLSANLSLPVREGT
jgi:hypothetical protein